MSQSVCCDLDTSTVDIITKDVIQIQPLRIQKNTPSSSPNKLNGAPTPRALAELGPMERRRNSPSYNQDTKVKDAVGIHETRQY